MNKNGIVVVLIAAATGVVFFLVRQTTNNHSIPKESPRVETGSLVSNQSNKLKNDYVEKSAQYSEENELPSANTDPESVVDFEISLLGMSKDSEFGVSLADASLKDKTFEEVNQIMNKLQEHYSSSQASVDNKYSFESHFLSAKESLAGFSLNRLECGDNVCIAVFDSPKDKYDWMKGPPEAFVDPKLFSNGKGRFDFITRYEGDQNPSISLMLIQDSRNSDADPF